MEEKTYDERNPIEVELEDLRNDYEQLKKERGVLVAQNMRLLDALRKRAIPAEEPEEKKVDEFAFLDKIFNKERI